MHMCCWVHAAMQVTIGTLKTRRVPRALLRELWISELRGMMTGTNKILMCLADVTLQLYGLVGFNCV